MTLSDADRERCENCAGFFSCTSDDGNAVEWCLKHRCEADEGPCNRLPEKTCCEEYDR